MKSTLSGIAATAGLLVVCGLAHAQQNQAGAGQDATHEANARAAESGVQNRTAMQARQESDLQGIEPVAPVAPPAVPVDVDQTGPAMVPVAPVEKFQGVETVTLQTDRGPVVVVSWPGTVPASEYNIDFSALDANGDGFIARQEAQAMAGRSEAARNLNLEFQVADKNGDGRLAFTEIIQWVY